MLAEFSIVPIGSGVSVSGPLAEVARIVDDSGLPYKVCPMGTVIEGEWDEVLGVIRRCHEAMMRREERVLTRITIDDRAGATGRLEGKVLSLELKAGRTLKK